MRIGVQGPIIGNSAITSSAHATPGPGDGLSLNLPDEPLVNFPAAPQAPEPPTVPIAPAAPAAPDLTKLPAWLGWVWLGGSVALVLVTVLACVRAFGSAEEPNTADEPDPDPTPSASAGPDADPTAGSELEKDGWALRNTEGLTVAPDLNRNGILETVVVGDLYGAGEMEEWLEQLPMVFTEYYDGVTRRLVERITVVDAETIRVKLKDTDAEVEQSMG